MLNIPVPIKVKQHWAKYLCLYKRPLGNSGAAGKGSDIDATEKHVDNVNARPPFCGCRVLISNRSSQRGHLQAVQPALVGFQKIATFSCWLSAG